MKRSKFTDERSWRSSRKATQVGRSPTCVERTGITEQTSYRWKAKYGGMELSETQRLQQLEDEKLRHCASA
jgi:putative transposase